MKLLRGVSVQVLEPLWLEVRRLLVDDVLRQIEHGDLIDAALVTQPIKPVTTAPDRWKAFRVIQGGRD